MSCPDCFKGAIHSHSTPTGHIETLFGKETYVATPPSTSTSTSTILFCCDAFGLNIINNKLLADQYATLTGFRVLDSGSANGTFLRVRTPVSLRAGDEVRMGRQCLRLEGLPTPAGAIGGGRVWGSPNQGYHFRLLQLLEGGGSAEALPLADGDHLIGRDEGGMTFPGDLAMSGRHAILTIQGEKAFLRDLGSANGTFMRIRGDCDLQVGDHLLMGNQQIRYESA